MMQLSFFKSQLPVCRFDEIQKIHRNNQQAGSLIAWIKDMHINTHHDFDADWIDMNKRIL